MSGFLANDSHVHAFKFDDLETILEMIKEYQYEFITVQGLSCCGGERQANNFISIALKAMQPKSIFVNGTFLYPKNGGAFSPEIALQQVKHQMLCGFDGIKMLEGKPYVRKYTGIPLDSEYYEPAFSYMEKEGIPLELHVADPEEFFSAKLCPEWAKGRGHGWYDKDVLPKEELEREALGIVKRHPGLKVSLAHWFFQSASYEKSVELLETYPNVFLDIVPGWEMYGNFTKDYDRFRELFTKYSERIIFGSDNLMVNWREIANAIFRFLETDDTFTAGEAGLIFSEPDMLIRGMNLPQEVLKPILRDNFFKFYKKPKELDYDRILAWAKEFAKEYDNPISLEQSVERIREYSERS